MTRRDRKKSQKRRTGGHRSPVPAHNDTGRADEDTSRHASRIRLTWLGTAVAIVGMIGAYLLTRSTDPIVPDGVPFRDVSEVVFEDFLGSDACLDCHAEQYDLWQESTHGNAGGPPTRNNVISEFDGTTLRFSDASVLLEIDGDGRFLYHVDQMGEPRQTFEVAALVGGGHMAGGGTQTTFARYSDGSLRLMPFDYSQNEQTWFCDGAGAGWLPIDGALRLGDCEFWPPQSNFGQNCGNCHSSQMESRFDPDRQYEEVRYKSLDINCESCHRPARRHVELVGSPSWREREDIGMEPLALRDTSQSVQVCFRCHATTERLQPGFLPGKRYDDYYSVHSFRQNKHYGDGRLQGFGYQEGHLYSDCYLNGSMTCVNCHDPHSQQYRTTQGQPLFGKFDDGQCTSCHLSKVAAGERHTGHAPDSPGSRCVACHMPFLQQPDVGPQIRYARSDHTIPIPRPAFDAALGIETACSGCHADKSVSWQQEAVEAQHGQLKPHKPIIQASLEVRSSQDPALARRRLLEGYEPHPAAEFDLLRAVGERIDLGGATMDPPVLAKLERLANHEDVDVSALALSFLHEADEANPSVRPGIEAALGSTGDREEARRRRWSLWLDIRGSRLLEPGQFGRGFRTVRKAAVVWEPQATLRMRLAMGQEFAGQPADALREYGAALNAGASTLEEHKMLLSSLCSRLEDLEENGSSPTAAIERLCDQSTWRQARQVWPPAATPRQE